MYTYKVVKEDFYTGKRSKRTRTITKYHPLEVGALYCHLGKGFKGSYRILKLLEVEELED